MNAATQLAVPNVARQTYQAQAPQGPATQRTGGSVLNVSQLIAKGSITGPYKRTRPVRFSWIKWQARKVQGAWDDLSEAVAIARRTWAHRRLLRTGMCPDEAPF